MVSSIPPPVTTPAPVRVAEATPIPPVRPVRKPVIVPVVPSRAPEEVVSAGQGNLIPDRKPVPALKGSAEGDRRVTVTTEKAAEKAAVKAAVKAAMQPRTFSVAAISAEPIRTIKPDAAPVAPANPTPLSPTIAAAPPVAKTPPFAKTPPAEMTGNTEKSDSLGINRGVPFGDELGITRGIAGGGAGINRGAGGNGGLGRGLGANSYQPGTPRFTLARPARSDDGPPIHIVYVIDISGSMEEGGKILRVRDAMEKALSELRNEDYFNIVFFSDRATLFAPTMRPATASNVSAGVLSVGVNEPNGATNLSAALDLALEQPEITHIFVMSDGEPTEGVTDFSAILALARQRNRHNARILTLALGQGERFKGMALLRDLAEENRGIFHYIDLRKR